MFFGANPKLEEIRAHIDRLRQQIQCPKGFSCTAEGLRPRCKAREVLLDDHIECLEPAPVACQFAQTFGHSYFCRCPVRVFLMKTLNL